MVGSRERQRATSNIACATSSRRWTRRRTTTGSRRSRSTSTGSPAAGNGDRRPCRRGPPRARRGQAGRRLWRRLYRRQLSARLGSIGNLAQPAGRRADRRPGRLATSITRACSTSSESPPTSIASAPTSRRSSRSSATTCRPKRGRITWRSTGAELETWRRGIKQARPKANVDLFLTQHERRGCRRGRRHGEGGARGRPVDRIGDRRHSKRGWRSSAASRTTRTPAASARSSSAPISPTWSTGSRAARSGSSPSPA